MDVKRRTVRLLRIAIASALCVFVLSLPAQARAADTIIAHDTLIDRVYAAGGDLVYFRAVGATPPSRRWMRWTGGKLSPARAIPQSAWPGAAGRDAKGRKVFTFAKVRIESGVIVSEKWFVYDIKRDRARRLHGLPGGCVTNWVSLWRRSMAYTAGCKKEAEGGLFVRQGKRTRKLGSSPGGDQLAFREGSLAVIVDDGADNFFIKQWMANGKRCVWRLSEAFGDATDGLGWYPSELSVGNGYLTWAMGHWNARPNFGILTANVPEGCVRPGPIGELPFKPKTEKVGALTIDGRRVFYANDTTLRRGTLPSKPSFAPPPNDDFEHAKELPAEAPFTATGRVAYATVQPGEPLADAKHTVWYAFRPATSGTVYVKVYGREAIYDFEHSGLVGTFVSGVYTGTSRKNLTEISSNESSVRVDAVAGETYWIAVASPVPEPYYKPFTLWVGDSPAE
jgi:hypothetical protein